MDTNPDNEIATLQREILILRDEIESLNGRLAFRSAQVTDLEAVAADRLLEIARLGIVNKNLLQRVAELEAKANSADPSIGDLGPDDEDYEDLAELMTEISGVVFEREHVHEILARSRGLLAGVLEWGAHDTVVRENLLDDVAEYLLGEDYRSLPSEWTARVEVLKAAGLTKGMQLADDDD